MCRKSVQGRVDKNITQYGIGSGVGLRYDRDETKVEWQGEGYSSRMGQERIKGLSVSLQHTKLLSEVFQLATPTILL